MSIKRVYAIFLRQVFLLRSNPVRLTAHFLFPIMSIVMWGFISKYMATFGKETFNFVAVILGAVVLWDFMSSILQRMMSAFLEDVWTRNFINYFASPLKVTEYISGLVLTSLITSSIGFALTISIAGLAFGYNILIMGLYIFPFLFLLLLFGIAVGLFITALIFRLGPSAEWLGWPIPFIMSIFVGVFYPASVLPGFMQIISKILPPSYIFDGMRAVIAGNFNIGANLFLAFVLSVAYLALTYLFFIKVYKRNLKTGAISRFGSEE